MTAKLDPPLAERVAFALQVAESMASRMFGRLRHTVDLDDLRSMAQRAAMQAAEQWDGRGMFGPYASQRIRWAVVDDVRREHGRRKVDAVGMGRLVALGTERAADLTVQGEVAAAAPDNPEKAIQALLGRAAAIVTVDLDACGLLVDTQEDVEGNVDRVRVRRAVEALPEPGRTVLLRHAYQGETLDEIAGAEGLPRQTVYSRYAGAVEKLRQAFAEPA